MIVNLLGAIFYRVREYLGQSGLTIGFKSFVRLICEYGNIIFMGTSATHLHKLDLIQKMAEKLCGTTFLSLASRRKASSIGLLCKLLDLRCPTEFLYRPYFYYACSFLSPCHGRLFVAPAANKTLLIGSIH